MNADRARTIGQAVNDALRERQAAFKRLETQEDALLEDEHSLRIITQSRTLSAEVMEVLAGFGFGAEYLGADEDGVREHQWLLTGSGVTA